MLPPPMTSAISTPVARTPFNSPASSSTTSAFSPKSCAPLRASPESLSRARLNAAGTLADRVPGVVDELDAALLQVPRDRARRFVGAIPRLLGQHRLAEELLVHLALDDLLADVFGLREDVFRF